MKIAVVGFGQTGQRIARFALDNKHTVRVIDPSVEALADKIPAHCTTFSQLDSQSLSGVDVAIDFTRPAAVLENCALYTEHNCNVVMGTTGWYQSMAEVQCLVEQSASTGFLYAHNFSIGVALFYKIVQAAAAQMSKFDSYDTAMIEHHHRFKQDSPSGTAEALAEILLEQLPSKTEIVSDRFDKKPEPHQLHVASVRCGSVPGTHQVLFDSAEDTIEVTHTARNRDGFAKGAVMAAEWLHGKRGFFTLDDMLSDRK